MLTKLKVQNFKAIANLSVEFTGRFTVIVGPNGSGKTSILQSILCLGFAYSGQMKPRFHGGPPGFLEGNSWYYGASTFGTRNNIAIEYEFGESKLRTIVSPTKQTQDAAESDFSKSSIVLSEMFDVDNNQRPKWRDINGVDTTGSWFPKPTYLELNPSRLSSPSQIKAGEQLLESDGRNLATVLAYLQTTCPQEFSLLVEGVQAVVPAVKLLRTHRVARWREPSGQLQNGTADEILIDTLTAKGVPARFASEGTLLILALLAAIVTPSEDTILLLDGIDLALHPSAQAKTIQLIRRLLELHPGLQIIATTHSPYILHSLEFDEVRLTTVGDDGKVACGRLMDHPDFDRWKDEMTPGEMWSLFGEKWIVNPPTPEPAT